SPSSTPATDTEDHLEDHHPVGRSPIGARPGNDDPHRTRFDKAPSTAEPAPIAGGRHPWARPTRRSRRRAPNDGRPVRCWTCGDQLNRQRDDGCSPTVASTLSGRGVSTFGSAFRSGVTHEPADPVAVLRAIRRPGPRTALTGRVGNWFRVYAN